ncbi:MAG: UxaA family hydrolase [Acidobacteriota bacterium]|nr:UxaA family hydrolase [Acidobacteriota bacterium]
MEPVDLESVAIVIRPGKDNVAVATGDLIEAGTQLRTHDGLISISGRVLRGQSFAIKSIQKGEVYVSLGDPIGIASKDVQPGDPIDHENLEDRLPRLRVRYRDNPQPSPIDPELQSLTFEGYHRPDGSVGTRNLVGVVTSGMCSSTEAHTIADRAMKEIYSREKFPNVDGVVAIVQESGCGMPDGQAVGLLNRLLADTLRHPNLGAAIYIDLGCGKTCVECSVPVFQTQVPDYNQRVQNLVIQNSGGSRMAVERGLEMVEKQLHFASQFERRPASIAKLTVGTKCGGSDRWSGVTANPAVGVAADMFVKAGSAVLLPEIPELQGAAMVDLAHRARTRAVGHKLMQALKRYEAYVTSFGEDFRDNPSPGNKKGGLYNIYLKSAGVKAKGGTSVVEDLVEYGEWLGERRGLFVLYTPGYDQISTPALFLSGAQVALFTTGRGTGIGSALGPVMKIGSNTPLARVNGDIDINAGSILDRKETTEEVGRKIFYETLAVASGRKQTRAEESGFHTEFKVWESLWPSL